MNQTLHLVIGNKDTEKMADQWGRLIWEAIQDISILPSLGSELNAALGNFPGIVPKVASGYALDLRHNSNYPFTVSVSAALYVGQGSSTFRLRYRFTSNDDAPGGVGARFVRFRGLSPNYEPFTQNSQTLGTAPQTIEIDRFRVYSVQVIETGTSGKNQGTLQCWEEGGFDTQRFITMLPGDNYGSVAALTAPVNQYVFLKYITVRVDHDEYVDIDTNLNNKADFRMTLQARRIAIGAPGVWTKILNFSVGDDAPHTFDINIMLKDLVDVRIQIESFTGFIQAPLPNIPSFMVSCELHYYEIDTGIVDVSNSTLFEVF